MAGPDGTFGNRFDDSEGTYRVLYASWQRLGCSLEILARFRLDPTLYAELAKTTGARDFAPFGYVPPEWAETRRLGSATHFGSYGDIYGPDWSAEDLWRAYIQLTEAEAAFRTYVLWKTLAQTCRTPELGDEPHQVFENLSKVALVEIALPTRTGVTIRKRCVSRPTEHPAILLQRLQLHLPATLDFVAV